MKVTTGGTAGLALSVLVAVLLAAAPAAAAGAAGGAKAAADPIADLLDAVRRGQALIHQGRTKEGVSVVREAAARAPRSPTVQFAAGGALMSARDYDGAIAALQAGLKLAPYSLLARKALARAQRGRGDLAAARATLEALWRDEPSFRAAGVDLAEVMAQQGDRRAAIETYRYLIDTYSAAEDARLAHIHASLGRVLEAEGDRAGALAAFREALRMDPKQPQARAALKRLSR